VGTHVPNRHSGFFTRLLRRQLYAFEMLFDQTCLLVVAITVAVCHGELDGGHQNYGNVRFVHTFLPDTAPVPYQRTFGWIPLLRPLFTFTYSTTTTTKTLTTTSSCSTSTAALSPCKAVVDVAALVAAAAAAAETSRAARTAVTEAAEALSSAEEYYRYEAMTQAELNAAAKAVTDAKAAKAAAEAASAAAEIAAKAAKAAADAAVAAQDAAAARRFLFSVESSEDFSSPVLSLDVIRQSRQASVQLEPIDDFYRLDDGDAIGRQLSGSFPRRRMRLLSFYVATSTVTAASTATQTLTQIASCASTTGWSVCV